MIRIENGWVAADLRGIGYLRCLCRWCLYFSSLGLRYGLRLRFGTSGGKQHDGRAGEKDKWIAHGVSSLLLY
jgi:hypothetical protein